MIVSQAKAQPPLETLGAREGGVSLCLDLEHQPPSPVLQ